MFNENLNFLNGDFLLWIRVWNPIQLRFWFTLKSYLNWISHPNSQKEIFIEKIQIFIKQIFITILLELCLIIGLQIWGLSPRSRCGTKKEKYKAKSKKTTSTQINKKNTDFNRLKQLEQWRSLDVRIILPGWEKTRLRRVWCRKLL